MSAGRAASAAPRTYFDGLESFGLVVLLAGLPLGEAFKSAGLGLAVLGFAGKLATGYRPHIRPRAPLLALGLFLVAAVASVLTASGDARRPAELLTLSTTIAAFPLILDSVAARPTRRMLFLLAVLAGVFVSASVAYADHMLGPYHRLVLPSIENAVPAAEYLGACVAVGLALTVTEIGAPVAGPLSALVTGLAAIALFMTKSRGPLIGAAGGCLVALAGTLRRVRPVLIVLLAVLCALWVFVAAYPGARIADRSPGGRRGVASRVDTWHRTALLIAERPLTGYGLGSYSSLGVVYEDEECIIRQPNAHNVWLHTAAETGLLGCGALTAFLVLGMVGSARAAFGRRGRRIDRSVAAAALGGVTALLVAGLFSVTTDAEPGILLFALLALGCARPDSGSGRQREEP